MAKKHMHGHKRRFQVLLDPNRARLFDSLAREEKLKTAAFLRKQLYQALELLVPKESYAEAAEADAEIRNKWLEQTRTRRSNK